MADEDLIRSAHLIGKSVFNSAGGKAGSIREVYLHRVSGEARFAIVEPGGVFGAGKFHPAPWRLLHLDALTGDYVLPLTKAQFRATPSYTREQFVGSAYGWSESVQRYFDDPSHP